MTDGPCEEPLRILHLEDDANDAELVHAQLSGSGLTFDALVVDDERSLRDALATRRFDLVISDNTLRGFNGLDALRIVRQAGVGAPFVFVSGTIGEEQAIEAMRAGADDYVLKHRLEKLPLTVDRVMRESRARAERSRVEAVLHERERLFSLLAQSVRDVFWVATADHARVLYVSPAFDEVWGQPADSLYRHAASKFERVHPDDREPLAEMMRAAMQPGGAGLTYRLERRDGTRWIRETAWPTVGDGGRATGLAGVARDVTEQMRLEEQLLQSRKLEAVGRLAGGIAHDFNNVLSVILGHCELLLDERGPGAADREQLEMILRSGKRAASLTRQLLAFSRSQVMQPRVLDVNSIIAEVTKLLGRVIGEDIGLCSELAADLGRVRADPGQIEQVLMNLAVNARDAMPAGGTIRIETRNVDVPPEVARRHGGAVPGPHVLIAVRDEGGGMPEEVRSRIFDPFFTTKAKERGTGLGLATVLGIVEQSGGFIEVDSEVGRGTTFRVMLPRVDAPVEAPAAPPEGRAATGRAETILLVEDEEEVRRLTVTLLKRSGYTVLETATAERAAEVVATHPGPIHVLLTDVVLPGRSGIALATELKRTRADMAVLLMSGYMPGDGRQGVDWGDFPVLEKPFTSRTLMQRLAEILDP